MQKLPPGDLSTELPVLPSDEISPHLVAIVPAAGLSRRMGRPKLLIDLFGRTVIARVIEALRSAGIARCLVVIRPDDTALIREATASGGEVVLPTTDPAEMRQSVEWALRKVEERKSGLNRHNVPPDRSPPLPSVPCDGWLLIPADHPTLNPQVILEMIEAWRRSPNQIAVAVHQGRRGHPTIFPWSLAAEVFQLPTDQGLNQLLRSRPERIREVAVSDPHILDDLDTPDDLRRLQQALNDAPANPSTTPTAEPSPPEASNIP